jgi:hypothetical protein
MFVFDKFSEIINTFKKEPQIKISSSESVEKEVSKKKGRKIAKI